jgi:hypothetical protein
MTPFQRFFVTAYRYLAIGALSLVLASAGGYAFVTAFYTANSTWAAPLIISKTHDRILQLKAEILRTQQSIDTLELAATGLSEESAALRVQAHSLADLLAKAKQARARERQDSARLALRLAPLQAAKAADAGRAARRTENVAQMERSIQLELQAGLITKDDAVRALATLDGIRNSATDTATARVQLDHQALELKNVAQTLAGGQASSNQALDMMVRSQELESQLTAIKLKLAQNEADEANKRREASELKSVVATLQDSPYFRATQATSPMSFAFVPYTNDQVAKVGESLYDCTFQILWCRKVGTVTKVHRDEERAQHPLFHVDLRGVLVELDLSCPEAAKSRVVFIGGAPLGV